MFADPEFEFEMRIRRIRIELQTRVQKKRMQQDRLFLEIASRVTNGIFTGSLLAPVQVNRRAANRERKFDVVEIIGIFDRRPAELDVLQVNLGFDIAENEPVNILEAFIAVDNSPPP